MTSNEETSDPLHAKGYSFDKCQRLLKKTDYKKVLEGGYKMVCPSMVLFVMAHSEGPRLGLIVSRKVGNAVIRNKVKRQLREIFRNFPDKENWDVVVIARKEAAGGNFNSLGNAFKQGYGRLQRNVQRRSASAV